MKNKLLVGLLIVWCLLTMGAALWLYFNPITRVFREVETKIQKDTLVVYKEVPKIVFKQLPAKTVTVYKTVHDTVYAWMKSDMDTFITVQNIDYGRLYVSYWHPPLDYFDIDFIPSPLPEKIITRTITSGKWYEKKEVWAGAAVLIGGIIAEARKK